MPPSTPGKPLSSVLRQSNTTQHKSLKTILKDVKEHNNDLDKTEQMRVAKTIKKLNDDPSKVLSKRMRKEALGALKNAGHLRGRFKKNFGAAMKEMDRTAASMGEKTFEELRNTPASRLTKEERRKLKMKENQMRARAAQEREEAEGKFHAGNHDTTRFGLEEWQEASVSANSSQRRQSRYALQDDNKKKKGKNSSSNSKPPIVDMMID